MVDSSKSPSPPHFCFTTSINSLLSFTRTTFLQRKKIPFHNLSHTQSSRHPSIPPPHPFSLNSQFSSPTPLSPPSPPPASPHPLFPTINTAGVKLTPPSPPLSYSTPPFPTLPYLNSQREKIPCRRKSKLETHPHPISFHLYTSTQPNSINLFQIYKTLNLNPASNFSIFLSLFLFIHGGEGGRNK